MSWVRGRKCIKWCLGLQIGMKRTVWDDLTESLPWRMLKNFPGWQGHDSMGRRNDFYRGAGDWESLFWKWSVRLGGGKVMQKEAELYYDGSYTLWWPWIFLGAVNRTHTNLVGLICAKLVWWRWFFLKCLTGQPFISKLGSNHKKLFICSFTYSCMKCFKII